MVSIAEAISRHLRLHSTNTALGRRTIDYAHIFCWENNDEIRTIRIIGKNQPSMSMEDDEQGAFYLAELHDNIINIANQDDYGDELYLCIYAQLYVDSVIHEINKIISWSKSSNKNFKIDVYGLADDIAKVFCTSTAEEHDLIRRSPEYSQNAKSNATQLIEYKDSEKINRFLLLQNCNLNGIGLNLDRNTLIKILGEFALLTTEQFNDVFPQTDFSRPDITAFGISALWFDKYFFTDYLLSHTYLYIMEREGVGQHRMDNPIDLLVKARKYIKDHACFLSYFSDNYIQNLVTDGNITNTKIEVCNQFKREIDSLKSTFFSVISDEHLSLPEKRAMLALFIREDDELFDDNVLLEELPTIDDCFEDALSLYIDEANCYEASGNQAILSGPRDENNKLYLPLAELKASKADVRKSQSFIRRCDKRIEALHIAEQITDDSKRRLTPEGFTFGETTYHLQHDIVEKPLEKTYIATTTPKKSVDLRSSFSSVRNQGKIGSCTAFSTTSVFEYILNKAETTKKHLLSPRFLYFNVCKKNDDGTPIDKGSSIFDNIKFLGTKGVCEERLCPYKEGLVTPSEEAVSNALSYLVTEAKNVNICHKDLTSALSDGHPVVITLKIFNSFKTDKNGFIFRPKQQELNSTDSGYHAMVLCGFSEKEKVYIVRNSWGTDFGDKGYCYIPFSYIEDSSLCRQACIITGISCSTIHKTSPNAEEILNFDHDIYAIEYAITRILKEEEQQELIKLEEKYNQLHAQYIKLIQELTNQGKRGVLTKHAVNRLYPVTTTPHQPTDQAEIVERTPRYGTEKIIIPSVLSVFAIILSFFSLFYISIPLLIAACVIGMWMMTATKNNIVVVNKKISTPSDDHSDQRLKLELKYTCAGQAIDAMFDLKMEIEKKHRYLTSYLGHFSMWLKSEQNNYDNLNSKIKVRAPFNTILSKEDFKKIFSITKDSFTQDISLWREFKDYSPTEESARDFQNRLRDKLRNRIEQLHREFSMCKFIMNIDDYSYLHLSHTKPDEWLNTIERQSVPFVHCSGINPNTRKVLIVSTTDATEKEQWANHITNSYMTIPICSYGGTSYKLSYIQMQALESNQVPFLNRE